MSLANQHHTVRYIGDAVAGLTSLSAFFGLLSPIVATIASALSVVWFVIQIREYIKRKQQNRRSKDEE